MAAASQPIERLIDVKEIGPLVKARRKGEGLSLRDLQDKLDNALTASALSRIEHGATPEPKNVGPLAVWLGIPMSSIAWPGQPNGSLSGRSTPDVVEVHLRADKKLDPKAADVLAQIFRRLYNDIASGDIPIAVNGKKP